MGCRNRNILYSAANTATGLLLWPSNPDIGIKERHIVFAGSALFSRELDPTIFTVGLVGGHCVVL